MEFTGFQAGFLSFALTIASSSAAFLLSLVVLSRICPLKKALHTGLLGICLCCCCCCGCPCCNLLPWWRTASAPSWRGAAAPAWACLFFAAPPCPSLSRSSIGRLLPAGGTRCICVRVRRRVCMSVHKFFPQPCLAIKKRGLNSLAQPTKSKKQTHPFCKLIFFYFGSVYRIYFFFNYIKARFASPAAKRNRSNNLQP